jgi:hypothetical protein
LDNDPVWIGDRGLELDGIDDFLDAGTTTFNISNEVTIVVNIYFTENQAGNFKGILQRGTYVFPYTVTLYGDRIRTCIRTSDTDWLTSNTSLEPYSWNHIVLTFSQDGHAIYINGQLDAYNPSPPSGALNTNGDYATTIGNWYQDSHHFNGIIDEIRIYNRALAAEEITGLFYTYNMTEKETLALLLNSNDSEGNPIIYSEQILNLPDNANANFNTEDKIFSWAPGYDSSGTYELVFQAISPSNYTHTVTVVVEDVTCFPWFKTFWDNFSEPMLKLK